MRAKGGSRKKPHNKSESRLTFGILSPFVMSHKPSRYCWPTPLQRSRSTFPRGSFLSFFVFQEGILGTAIHYVGVGQQYPPLSSIQLLAIEIAHFFRQLLSKIIGYCWRTPHCRNGCIPHAFVEGKKAGETVPR